MCFNLLSRFKMDVDVFDELLDNVTCVFCFKYFTASENISNNYTKSYNHKTDRNTDNNYFTFQSYGGLNLNRRRYLYRQF